MVQQSELSIEGTLTYQWGSIYGFDVYSFVVMISGDASFNSMMFWVYFLDMIEMCDIISSFKEIINVLFCFQIMSYSQEFIISLVWELAWDLKSVANFFPEIEFALNIRGAFTPMVRYSIFS